MIDMKKDSMTITLQTHLLLHKTRSLPEEEDRKNMNILGVSQIILGCLRPPEPTNLVTAMMLAADGAQNLHERSPGQIKAMGSMKSVKELQNQGGFTYFMGSTMSTGDFEGLEGLEVLEDLGDMMRGDVYFEYGERYGEDGSYDCHYGLSSRTCSLQMSMLWICQSNSPRAELQKQSHDALIIIELIIIELT